MTLTYIERGTCNTIDDVTGEKVKLSDTHRRWDGLQVTSLNMEPRQPQDFPVTPRSPKVYSSARTNAGPVQQTPPTLVIGGE